MNLKSLLSLSFGIITLSCSLPAFADIPTPPDQLNPMSPAPGQPNRDRSKLKASADNDSVHFNVNNKIDPTPSRLNPLNRRATIHKQPQTPGISAEDTAIVGPNATNKLPKNKVKNSNRLHQ